MSFPEHFFGRYEYIAKLSNSRMAELFLAVARGPAGFCKLQLIKELLLDFVKDAERVRGFFEHARLMECMNHPNLVHTQEVLAENGRYAIVMEYLEGQSLDAIMNRLTGAGQTLPRPLVLRIFVEMLSGLHYVHEFTDYDGRPLGIVHRDVSPQNVFVTYDGQIKLIDSEIAIVNNRSIDEATTSIIQGQVPYTAPEQTGGPKATDRRADVFGAGVILYEALAGRPMWEDATDVHILCQLIGSRIPSSPKAINPSVPDALDRICAQALAASREARYPTAAAFQDAIEEYVKASGELAGKRDVGQFVSNLFDAEKNATRTMIDEQLQLLGATDPPTNLAPLAPSALAWRGPGLLSSREGIELDVAGRPRTSAMGGITPAPTTIHLESSAPVAGTVPSAAPWSARARRRAPLVVGALGAVAGCLIAYLGDRSLAPSAAPLSERASTTPPPMGQSSAAPAATGAPAARSDTVILAIEASPATARLFLDDAALSSNPFVGALPKDGVPHRLHAESPGYLRKTEVVTFDDDIKLRLVLDRERPRSVAANKPTPAGARPPSPPPTTKSAGSQDTPVAGASPRAPAAALASTADPFHALPPRNPLEIDKSDPYGR